MKDISIPTEFGPIRYRLVGQLALVTIDNPPVNAGSLPVRVGLLDAILQASRDAVVGAVIAGAGNCFVAGSDLREFGKPLEAPELPDVIAAIEAAPFPVVAALHGVALGGGLELALGCDYRIAAPQTLVGLPEVSLGFVPGAGGTQRLPRLVGVAKAIELVCGAKSIQAEAALQIGLLDAVADNDLVESALAFLSDDLPPKRRAMDLTPPQGSDAEISRAIETAHKRGKGRPNVDAAIRLVRAASVQPAADALRDERAVFQDLRVSDEAFALRHLFFAERKATSALSSLPNPQNVETVGVVGGGTMGQGIARAFLAAGFGVTLVERDRPNLEGSLSKLHKDLGGLVSRGRITKDEGQLRVDRLDGATDLAALSDCDLVIEDVFEDMEIKKALLADLESVVPKATLLATNTSYLDIDEMTAGLAHPERVLGLHFFSPADVMKLLEVVRAERTSDHALATGLRLAKSLKKQAVVARVGEGFVGNRIYAAYRRRAELLVLDGAWPEDVDAAITDFGFAMGPFAVSDMSGLDIAWAMRKRQAKTRDPRARYVTIADTLCEAGRLGRKSGAGWYSYAGGAASPDPIVADIISAARRSAGITAKTYDTEVIQRQLLAAIVNEAACLLDEGIAESASDVDVVLANGYGFPRWRGGPLYWASQEDPSRLADDLDVLENAVGHGFQHGPTQDILTTLQLD